jgi:hypothetical protein
MKRIGLLLGTGLVFCMAALVLYPAGKVYKPDMNNCAGFTAADAGKILGLPASAITAKTQKLHATLWMCMFSAGTRSVSFSVALAGSAEEAAADMARYRENLEFTAETPPFKDSLPKGAWSEISPLGDENTWTDVNHTLSARQGNVTIQVQAPADKLKQIEVAEAFLKKLK